MKLGSTVGVLVLAVSGCVATPKSPMEAYLNRYAGAEAVAMNCPASIGGYGGVATMRADAQANLAKAKSLGATEADLQKARQQVNGTLQGSIIMWGAPQACSAMVNQLGWLGDSKPNLPPSRPAT